MSPGVGVSVPCPDATEAWSACGIRIGGPFIPASRPFVRMKCFDTLSVAVSISTSCSSIMHTE